MFSLLFEKALLSLKMQKNILFLAFQNMKTTNIFFAEIFYTRFHCIIKLKAFC